MRTRRIRLKRAAVWVGLLVSAAFAYVAVRNAHVDEVWSALKLVYRLIERPAKRKSAP